MTDEVSAVRLNVLRCMYLLNCVLVGSGVWLQFIHRQKPWDPITGVAFSFWAVAIPWSYVFSNYIKKPGDRWN